MNDRKIVNDIIEHVLEATSPHALLRSYIKKLRVEKYEKIAVISIGKAARTMGDACISLLPRKPDYELYADEGHPLPTIEGVKKTKRIIDVAKKLTEKDLAIVLVSGGGSAMFVQPAQGISLKDKIATTKALLMCGATINEINTVRKHLSQVKGGRLAALLSPATIQAFVISDVVGNDLSTIASGPLVADKSTFKDAVEIIKKYHAKIPKKVLHYLEENSGRLENESIKPGTAALKKVRSIIIADHYTALKAAAEKAKKYKMNVVREKEMCTGEACITAEKIVKKYRQKNTIYLVCGETTVTCGKKHGYGGRNQEFVLSALQFIKPHQTIASFGTDGVDGMCPEEVAGAIGDAQVLTAASKQKLNLQRFLKDHDSYTFFKKTNGLLITGPTGNNLGDLMILINQ
ncbi:DUF4147 domain-containing protein [Candidatus Gracilibacteria bacterium]|nr:DUF4147 domain-containing protein [Candidatus Gracilibacteria bacterium]